MLIVYSQMDHYWLHGGNHADNFWRRFDFKNRIPLSACFIFLTFHAIFDSGGQSFVAIIRCVGTYFVFILTLDSFQSWFPLQNLEQLRFVMWQFRE